MQGFQDKILIQISRFDSIVIKYVIKPQFSVKLMQYTLVKMYMRKVLTGIQHKVSFKKRALNIN